MTASEGQQRPVKPVYPARTLTAGAGLSAGRLYAAGKLARSRHQPPSHPAAPAAKEHHDGRP